MAKYAPVRRRNIPDDLRQCPVVEITWHDACTLQGWQMAGDVLRHGIDECRTAGYLITNTSREIKVLQSISATGGMGNPMAIPAKWVKKIRVLKPGRKTA